MDKLRLRFSKTGRAKYISHLDLMRVMQRAFLRAGLPIKYSEGFNPHAVLSIALPLSLGMESECEILDFRLSREVALNELPGMLNAALPEGITVFEAYVAERKASEIKWLRVLGELEYDSGVYPDLNAFFARESIVVLTGKKLVLTETDIRPMIHTADFDSGRLELVISAQNPTLNPMKILSALYVYEPESQPDFFRFRRLEAYDAEFNVFR